MYFSFVNLFQIEQSNPKIHLSSHIIRCSFYEVRVRFGSLRHIASIEIEQPEFAESQRELWVNSQCRVELLYGFFLIAGFFGRLAFAVSIDGCARDRRIWLQFQKYRHTDNSSAVARFAIARHL